MKGGVAIARAQQRRGETTHRASFPREQINATQRGRDAALFFRKSWLGWGKGHPRSVVGRVQKRFMSGSLLTHTPGGCVDLCAAAGCVPAARERERPVRLCACTCALPSWVSNVDHGHRPGCDLTQDGCGPSCTCRVNVSAANSGLVHRLPIRWVTKRKEKKATRPVTVL